MDKSTSKCNQELMAYRLAIKIFGYVDSEPKNLSSGNYLLSDAPKVSKSGWYDEKLHLRYLRWLIGSSYMSGYEIDKSINFDNNMTPLYTVFANDGHYITIYQSDFHDIATKVIKEIELSKNQLL